MSRLGKLRWKHWSPGLDNGHWKLGDVIESLPGAGAIEIAFMVKVFENPASPIALPGAITLARHDAVHAMVGRGLRPQDEGFVIGFTMGSDPKLKPWHCKVFKFVSRYLYPKAYKFYEDDLMAWDLGVGAARKMGVPNLAEYPFEDPMDRTLDDLRKELKINLPELHAIYRKETLLAPDTEETRRLDTDIGGRDPSDIHPPEGDKSDWKRERGQK
ncbi:MAG: hypothetical protein Alpg2KO_16250 [Alphaproteobacteria bacterium]